MPRCTLVFLLALILSAPAAFGAGPEEVFEVAGRAPDVALLTAPTGRTTRLDHNSPMLRRLDGTIGELNKRGLALVRRFAAEGGSIGSQAEHVATIHLLNKAGEDGRIELLTDGGETVWARRADDGGLATIPRARLDAAYDGWDRLGSGADSRRVEPGVITDLPGPYVDATIKLDNREIRDRLNSPDRRYPARGTTRRLGRELLWVRLPEGHTPEQVSGVIVWVSPTPTWRIPPHFNAVLDELGLIACGADNAGNVRTVTERLQLMFDALENVRRRWAVDEKRIYVTGFSGGGRCSSMLLIGWPETFAGAVPIVGLNSFHRLPGFSPGKIIPAQVGMPDGRRLDLARSRRIWSFTGDNDGNRDEMETRTDKLEFDGFKVRITTVPEIGHDMPPADELQEAVRWVDEPRREAIEAEAAEADAALAEIAGGPPETDEQRAKLVGLTGDYPWTEAAWQAAVWLGYERPEERSDDRVP